MKFRQVSSIFFAFLVISSFFMLPISVKAGDLANGKQTEAIVHSMVLEEPCKALGINASLWKNAVSYMACRGLRFANELLFTPVVAFACLMTESMLSTNFDPNIHTGYDTFRGNCRIYD